MGRLRILLAIFLIVITTPVHPQSCGNTTSPTSPTLLCDDYESMAYKREGGFFKRNCSNTVNVDCSPCLKLTVYCDDEFSIYLSGSWVPSTFRIIWKCNSSLGNSTEGVHSHMSNISNVTIRAPSDYSHSSCKFGACYQSIFGRIYFANITQCIPRPRTEYTTVSHTTVSHTNSTWLTTESQKESRLITLTVLPVVLLLAVLTAMMGCYILRLSYSHNNHKRVKHQMVFPQGINVFDASFQPVSVELRIKLSESQDSIYYPLEHNYEKISSQSQEKFAHASFQDNSMFKNNIGDGDGYSVVKEVESDVKEEKHVHEMVHEECDDMANLKNYCHHVSKMDYDDSSGFVSTGFDYVDTRGYGDNVELQASNFHNDPDCLLDQVSYESDNNKMWPEEAKRVVHADIKEENEVSPTNEEFGNLEDDIFFEASDSEVDVENPLYEVDYMEELCLTPDDGPDICMQQHYSSESDLSSHYISASGVID